MENLNKIKNKVEEMKAKYSLEQEQEDNPNHSDGFGMYWSGFFTCLKEISFFLDSLQQENKPNLLKSLEEYFEKTSKEQLDSDWEKLKVYDEIGPDVETYCKAQREQQEVDLEKEIEDYWIATEWSKVITLGKFKVIARYFYGLGQLNSK